jgi:hypothetical protein
MSVYCRHPVEFVDFLKNWVVATSDSLIQMARSRLYRKEPIFAQARKLANALTTDIFDHLQGQDVGSARFPLGIGLCLGGFVIHANLGHVGHLFAGLQQ